MHLQNGYDARTCEKHFYSFFLDKLLTTPDGLQHQKIIIFNTNHICRASVVFHVYGV